MLENFKKHEIDDYTLGEILQETRKKRNISVEQIARILKIKEEYLTALEKGEYNKLPKGVYGRSFLREYCYYLKLNIKQMLKLYDQEEELFFNENKAEEIFGHKRTRWSYFLSLPKLIRNIILVLAIIVCVVYLGLRIRAIVAPPTLNIHFPLDNYITEDNRIEIIGDTEDETRIFINNEEVFGDEQNMFKQEINLKQGINIIKIKAQKKYGKDVEIVRQVLIK